MTAMLAYQFWFRTLIDSDAVWYMYVYMDASPQWRGRELVRDIR